MSELGGFFLAKLGLLTSILFVRVIWLKCVKHPEQWTSCACSNGHTSHALKKGGKGKGITIDRFAFPCGRLVDDITSGVAGCEKVM